MAYLVSLDKLQPITQEDHGVLTIVGMPPNALSINSGKEIRVQYGNRFRYDLGAQTTQMNRFKQRYREDLDLAPLISRSYRTTLPPLPLRRPLPMHFSLKKRFSRSSLS